MSLTRHDFFLIILLALLPCLFFWRLLTPNEADRQQILQGDFTEQYYPLRAFTAKEWVSGHIPLWNPYLFGGQPALADIQSGALYPPHVLEALLLSWGSTLILGRDMGFPLRALAWQVVFHFSLASVGTYLFFRYQTYQPYSRQTRFGAFIAALTFTYGGYLTGFPVQQLTILETAVWLPWLLWALAYQAEATSWSAKWRGVCGGGFILALAILAGHPQTVLYIVYVGMAYALFLGRGLVFQGNQSKILGQCILPFIITMSLGIGLAAPQILPTLEFISYSLRADLNYTAVSAGLPLAELVAMIYPGYLGGSPQYVGIIGLILWLYALMQGRPRAEIAFWAVMVGLSLLLALGGHTFLYGLFYLLAPGFDRVRQQERAFFIYSFSAAILIGYGAIHLIRPLTRLERAIFLHFKYTIRIVNQLCALLLISFIYGSTDLAAQGQGDNLFVGVLRHHVFLLLLLAGFNLLLLLRQRRWLRRWWGQGLLAGWLAFNLFTINWQFNLAKPTASFSQSGVVQFLQAQTPHERIVSGGLLMGGNSAASIYGLQDITGNTPLQLASVDKFLTQLPSWRMWQLMHVRYVVADRDIGDAGLKAVFQDGTQWVFEMADPFPLAWFVSQVEVMADSFTTLSHLSEDSFNLRQTAITRQALSIPLAPDPQATVTLDSTTPTQWQFTVSTSTPQFLVISHINYPGWQAILDGQTVETWSVNEVLMGVVIPPGQHHLDLSFRPKRFELGIMIAVISGLSMAIGYVITRRLEI